MNHLLTIDIGNTRAKYAVFDGKNIVETSVFNPEENDLELLLKRYPQIKEGIISSVGGKIDECSRQLSSIKVHILSAEMPLPFKLNYTQVKEMGSDRLADIAAALEMMPGKNVLVIDIGTCITYDILTADKCHVGGPISPGLKLRFKVMNEYTAKLPLCQPTNDELSPLCSSTEECLQAGVILGTQYEIEGFINFYSNIYNDLSVFLIGGDNKFFENRLKNCIFANSNFAFNGLRFILDYYENH